MKGRKLRRLFTAKAWIAGESLLGLGIAIFALAISAVSLLQSRQANRTAVAANALVEENNRINKNALALSERLAAAKEKLTLSAVVSDNPKDTLILKPTSSDFVLSDSHMEYMRLVAERIADKSLPPDKASDKLIPEPFTEETSQAGVHSLSVLRYVLEETIASAVEQHKWRVQTLTNIDTYDIAGYFPILVRVEYVYEGREARAILLYDLFYSGDPVEQVDRRDLEFGKPRLVRVLQNNEDPGAVLRERFYQWEQENFTKHREPELASPTPSPKQNSTRKQRLHQRSP